MNDTFVMAPLMVIGCYITVVVVLVIAGITVARYVVRRWND